MHIETLDSLFLGKRAVRMLGTGLCLTTKQPTKSPTNTSAAFRIGSRDSLEWGASCFCKRLSCRSPRLRVLNERIQRASSTREQHCHSTAFKSLCHWSWPKYCLKWEKWHKWINPWLATKIQEIVSIKNCKQTVLIMILSKAKICVKNCCQWAFYTNWMIVAKEKLNLFFKCPKSNFWKRTTRVSGKSVTSMFCYCVKLKKDRQPSQMWFSFSHFASLSSFINEAQKEASFGLSSSKGFINQKTERQTKPIIWKVLSGNKTRLRSYLYGRQCFRFSSNSRKISCWRRLWQRFLTSH